MHLSPEQLAARKKRNVAIAGALLNLKRNIEARAAMNAAEVVATP